MSDGEARAAGGGAGRVSEFEVSALGDIARARHWLRHACGAQSSLSRSGELVATELLTNALIHANGRVRLRLLGDAVTWLRIEVDDGSPAAPSPRSAALDAIGGRGLLLVESLSARWGIWQHATGKTVWADVAK
jgi:anti-sigma regulatory factor (Ser/Thr protein kinase)